MAGALTSTSLSWIWLSGSASANATDEFDAKIKLVEIKTPLSASFNRENLNFCPALHFLDSNIFFFDLIKIRYKQIIS